MFFPRQKFARNCKSPKMIKLTESDKDDILHLHNGLRNKIALGKQYPFPSAVKMQTVVREKYYYF